MNPLIPDRVSPDGSVEVRYSSLDVRMSVWVHEPSVRRTRDGAVLLDCEGTLLDGAEGLEFPGPGLVRLRLRKYPRGDVVRYDVTIDVEAETFVSGEGPPRPLAEIGKVVSELC